MMCKCQRQELSSWTCKWFSRDMRIVKRDTWFMWMHTRATWSGCGVWISFWWNSFPLFSIVFVTEFYRRFQYREVIMSKCSIKIDKISRKFHHHRSFLSPQISSQYCWMLTYRKTLIKSAKKTSGIIQSTSKTIKFRFLLQKTHILQFSVVFFVFNQINPMLIAQPVCIRVNGMLSLRLKFVTIFNFSFIMCRFVKGKINSAHRIKCCTIHCP